MNKVGISSVHTGYNYGSALQSYATKITLNELGYEGLNISLKGSLIKGRDVRIKKILVMLMRTLMDVSNASKKMKVYKNRLEKPFSEETKELFHDFITNYINPYYCTWSEMKRIAKKNDFKAFLCGSDQIWSGETLYVDPQYFLRYAPMYKRISFAPSFGNKSVANYNKKAMKRYINEIPRLSVREDTGVKIINELTGRTAVRLIDPTLLLDGKKWDEYLNLGECNTELGEYVLAYFLSEPSDHAKKSIHELAKKNGLRVVAIPYLRPYGDWYDTIPHAGPIEFVKMVKNAKFVCTDSFHGTAFSVIYQVPFFTFDRQYGKAVSQSTRIVSFLSLISLESRFEPVNTELSKQIDFNVSVEVLESERRKSISYLVESLDAVDEKGEGKNE